MAYSGCILGTEQKSRNLNSLRSCSFNSCRIQFRYWRIHRTFLSPSPPISQADSGVFVRCRVYRKNGNNYFRTREFHEKNKRLILKPSRRSLRSIKMLRKGWELRQGTRRTMCGRSSSMDRKEREMSSLGTLRNQLNSLQSLTRFLRQLLIRFSTSV